MPGAERPARPAYGSNDWYWAYGKNSAATVLDDARHIVELSPADRNRPFAVIDDGWQPQREDKELAGVWIVATRSSTTWRRSPVTCVARGAPGIWIRPLLAPADAPDAWRLARDRAFLDPTVPESLQKVSDDIARLRAWGFD